MNNIFQIILHGLLTIFTVVTLPVASLFTANQKPTIIPTPTITISPIPSASPSPSPVTHRVTPTIQKEAEDINQLPSLVLPTATPIQSPIVQIYRILSLSELVNMNGAEAAAITAAQAAYNQFLQIANLQYMSPTQQQQIFTPLLTSAIQNSLNQQKEQLLNAIQQRQMEIDRLNQQAQQTQNNNQSAQNIQICFDNKATSINKNPYLSEGNRQAQLNKAYQDCVNQNQ